MFIKKLIWYSYKKLDKNNNFQKVLNFRYHLDLTLN